MDKQERVLRLRRNGLTYKAIGVEVGLSERQCRRLCDAAYQEYVASRLEATGIALGEELDRLDGLIRAGSAVLVSPRTSAAEKMRALAEVRKCSEAKIRWLGAGAPERILHGSMDRAAMAEAEVAGLDQDALERELSALGWHKDDDTGPSEGDRDAHRALERADD